MRKPSRKYLVRELDKVCSLIVRKEYERAGGDRCPFCHVKPIEGAFHWVTRARYSVRWDLEKNIWASCNSCNYRYEFDPHPFIKVFLERKGVAAYEELVRLSHVPMKFDNLDLQIMLQNLRKRLEGLN